MQLMLWSSKKNFMGYEFHNQYRAKSTKKMFEYIKNNSIDDLTAWIGRLLYENAEVYYNDDTPGVAYVQIETVKLLHDILNLKIVEEFTL